MKIFIASDHAGFDLKQSILKQLKAKYEWVDLGPSSPDRTDYPDYADRVAQEMKKDSSARGFLICGSGQGMVMRANKYPHIRAALCWNLETAALSRQHNDANLLCVGSRLVDEKTVFEIIETFYNTAFEGGRHAGRVAKISAPI